MAHQRIYLDRQLYIRWPDEDFSDDGTKFVMYKYKNKLPISRASGTENLYLSIRLDYIGISYSQYCRDSDITYFYNGVPRDRFDLQRFNQFCEYIYQKYIENNPNIEKPTV